MELVPPGYHRINTAEIAIRNFKAHFLSMLVGTAGNCLKLFWGQLLMQIEITVILLWQPNLTTIVLAYAHLNGPFDYNKMPLALMGLALKVHKKTDKRNMWLYHSVNGLYLSMSTKQHGTHTCHVKSTRSKQLTDTVQFNHNNITNLTVTHTIKILLSLCKQSQRHEQWRH